MKSKIIIFTDLDGTLLDKTKFHFTQAKKYISELISKNIIIIEDSAHAFCGENNGHLLGKFADFAVFSFYATKSITCGEGGAIITNHKDS